MRPHLKVALVTLALICMLAWMRDITVSNKDSIENGSAVETVEDLEHSTITDLLSEMEKGSMQREFSIEKQAERTWQVATFHFYNCSSNFYDYFYSVGFKLGSFSLDWIGDTSQVYQQHQQLLPT